jgi:hypothetical protein
MNNGRLPSPEACEFIHKHTGAQLLQLRALSASATI